MTLLTLARNAPHARASIAHSTNQTATNMPTGWVKRGQSRQLPRDWATRIAAVWERAGGRCEHIMQHNLERCPERGRDVDHINERDNGGTDELGNLQLLCDWHHRQKTGRYAGRKSQKMRRERAKRDAGKHPGIRNDSPRVRFT